MKGCSANVNSDDVAREYVRLNGECWFEEGGGRFWGGGRGRGGCLGWSGDWGSGGGQHQLAGRVKSMVWLTDGIPGFDRNIGMQHNRKNWKDTEIDGEIWRNMEG